MSTIKASCSKFYVDSFIQYVGAILNIPVVLYRNFHRP
jgi:hypothetical protein